MWGVVRECSRLWEWEREWGWEWERVRVGSCVKGWIRGAQMALEWVGEVRAEGSEGQEVCFF